MSEDLLYLRQDIKVEPLFDRWYAWSHLIPPATAARNITERHLNIMDSYIDAPEFHASAVANPKMLGGPFIDYQGERVDEIAALREQTIERRAPLLELSAALGQLNDLLQREAKGFSMRDLYKRVPEILRGYVELVYDLNNNPSFRLIEPLLYKSSYYDVSAQSLALSVITGDDRPFVLSTPRLDSEDTLIVDWGFAEGRVDALFRLKNEPRAWTEIRSLLGITDEQSAHFRSFFTPDAPPRYQSYTGDGVRWRYFGHACVLLETANISILFDPVLSYTYDSQLSRYTYLDLPDKIDYVIITHNHQDHILFETLLQIRHKTGEILVPRSGSGMLQDPSLRMTLQYAGFPNVRELNELEAVRFDGGQITGLPFFGEHSDLAINTKLAYLVELAGEKLLFAADSSNIEPRLYEHLHHVVKDVDVLFLGMECDGAPLSWLYGPLMLKPIDRAMDQSRRLSGSDYQQGIQIVNALNVKEVYVYAMGQEPWLNYIMSIKYTEQSRPIVESDKLIAECRSRGMIAERLFGEKEILISKMAPSLDPSRTGSGHHPEPAPAVVQ